MTVFVVVPKWQPPAPCRDPEHQPPGLISLPAGAYLHVCPRCGKQATFRVQGVTLHAEPAPEARGLLARARAWWSSR